MHIDLNNIEKGIKLFNEGNYFEAHETWEDQWRGIEKSPEKNFIQGLIVIAVALHHYKRKNYKGTSKLLGKGIKLLQELKEPKMNINIKVFFERDNILSRKVQCFRTMHPGNRTPAD